MSSPKTDAAMSYTASVKAGSINDQHLITAIDILPTLCELIDHPLPADLDGKSFLTLLKEESVTDWREFVYKQQNDRNKARGIQTADWLYIINPWADGETTFGSVSTGMHCWKILKEASEKSDATPLLKDWVHRIEFRAPEELFDIKNDPECLYNLADQAEHKETIAELRTAMLKEAQVSGDHWFVDCIQNPTDPAIMKNTVESISAYQALRTLDPTASRRVHYDPLDDWMVIDNTIFEPVGEFEFWLSSNDSTSFAPQGDDDYGPNCLKFESNGAATSLKFDGSHLTQIRLEFVVPQGIKSKSKRKPSVPGPNITAKSKLHIEYFQNNDWVTAETIQRRFARDQRITIAAPEEGFSKETKIRFRAELAEGEHFGIDAVRLTGWQDWTTHTDGRARQHWETASQQIFEGQAFQLSTGQASDATLKKTLGSALLGELKIHYHFTASPTGKLHLELGSGNKWRSIAEHNFAYVLEPRLTYSHLISITKDIPRDAKLRFRIEGEEAKVKIDQIQVSSRKAF
ncbi:MAG: sulfatase/phosphatase domain-containing protein [Verrucomicrobiota bacterium]